MRMHVSLGADDMAQPDEEEREETYCYSQHEEVIIDVGMQT